MKAERLLECLNGVDEALLCRCERSVAAHRIGRVAVSVALCLCLVITAVALVPEKEAPLPPPANGNWTVHYIQSEPTQSGPQACRDTFGFFSEDLTEKELKAVLPKKKPEWMTATGTSDFDSRGNLWSVNLDITTTDPDTNVLVHLSRGSFTAYEPDERPTISTCNGVVFWVYEYPAHNEGRTVLYAFAYIGKARVQFTCGVANENLVEAKQDFKQILESFTYYGEKGKPGLSKIRYEYIPESYRKNPTLEEARKDPDFGRLIPKTIPQGYGLELEWIERRKSVGQNIDDLSISWYNMSTWDISLHWYISYFTEEDEDRLVHVDEDCWSVEPSPIFYVEEVTLDTVYECQSHSAYDDIYIRIKCGDYLVSISTEKLDEMWVYEQILWLREIT